MRTGEWILANHALPKTEVFAWPVAGRPFTEYSWVFDIMADWMYRHGGLLTISIFVLLMSVGIAAVLFSALFSRCHNVLLAGVATALATLTMYKVMSPRPWLFTILLFIAELWILIAARGSGDMRRLFWLVPVFFCWANLHVQFPYGFIALFLFAVDEAVSVARSHDSPERKRLIYGALAIAASIGVTLLTPFGFNLYRTVIVLAGQSAAFRNISEVQAPTFRDWIDYLAVGLVAASGVVVGRLRNRVEPFLVALCAVGAVLAFHSARDVWVLAIPAAFIVCTPGAAPLAVGKKSYVVAAVVCVGVLTLLSANRLTTPALQESLARRFPVSACDFIGRSQMSGRMFTPFDWGGYVMWRFPNSSVSMDGRTIVHGDERLERHVLTGNGGPDWESDPDVVQADLLIVMKGMPLYSLLRQSNRYRLLHDDALAGVFVHGKSTESAPASSGN